MTSESQPLHSPDLASPTHDTPPPLPTPSMPAFAPQFPPAASANGNGNGNGNRVQHRHSRDFSGPQSNGAVGSPPSQGLPIQHRMANGQQGHVRGMSGFEGPRSPPNSKSERTRHKKHHQKGTTTDTTELKGTAHVPCKFFRQGVCQAGKACPFLHTNDLATETAPCKYFQKVRRKRPPLPPPLQANKTAGKLQVWRKMRPCAHLARWQASQRPEPRHGQAPLRPPASIAELAAHHAGHGRRSAVPLHGR